MLPPVLYAWWVPGLGLALLAAAALWLLWLLARARRRGPEAAPVDRQSFLARVDGLEDRFARGETDLRGLHLALAALVREFGTARLGRDITPLTRREVDAAFPQTGLGELLGRFEQPSFAQSPEVEAATSLRRTREAVGSW